MKKFPAVFRKLQEQHTSHERVRREVIAKSNEAIGESKRAIFALHRGDPTGAEACFSRAQQCFEVCEKLVKNTADVRYEGAYSAALEEYAEARLFSLYIFEGVFGEIEARAMEPRIYLAGLADATGEVVRYTIREVTKGKTEHVMHAYETIEQVMEFMLGLDATGYLRTKFDQAKSNLKRIEDLLYDLSIRKSMDVSSR